MPRKGTQQAAAWAILRRKQAFLTAFALCPEGRYAVAVAAEAAGVHRATPYRWRAADPLFAARWDALAQQHLAQLQQRVAAELAQRTRAHAARQAELAPQRQAQARKNFGYGW